MEPLTWESGMLALVAAVIGIVVGRLSAPQKATALHWAPIIRSLAHKIAEANPERTPADVAAELVDLACTELGVPETEEIKAVAEAAARLATTDKRGQNPLN